MPESDIYFGLTLQLSRFYNFVTILTKVNVKGNIQFKAEGEAKFTQVHSNCAGESESALLAVGNCKT